jgi:general secretion pathway protein A
MYASHFGLKENPFNLSPDPRYLFLSEHHREALNHLIYGITERKGFIVMTGGIGTGKTTLCRSFLASLDGSVESALVFNSAMTDLELLETINQEFHIPVSAGEKSKKRCIDALNGFLLKSYGEGKNVVLLIDEAQNLSHEMLEQLRLISNLETEREKLIQMVLIGQPELQAMLLSPSLKQLSERITVRYELNPLDGNDVERYIRHRLSVAGGGESVSFSRPACRLVYRHSRGIPRRINAICDRAMLIAYTRDTASINRRIMQEAVRDIGPAYLVGSRTPGRHRLGWLSLVIAVLLAAVTALVYGDRIMALFSF